VIDVGRVDHDLVAPLVADRPECLDGSERQREEEDVGPNGILDLRTPNSTRPRVSLRFACLTRPVPDHERSLRYFYFLHISVYPS
jgi:hypothetical protein